MVQPLFYFLLGWKLKWAIPLTLALSMHHHQIISCTIINLCMLLPWQVDPWLSRTA